MINKSNLSETQAMFEQWWRRENAQRPMMQVRAWLAEPTAKFNVPENYTAEQHHSDIDIIMPRFLNEIHSMEFRCEAVPNLNINFGPGSLAAYMGSEPRFEYDTVWYTECIKCVENYQNLQFDPENYWFKRHFALAAEAKRRSNDQFYVCMPDIVENIDIIAAMRGPEDMCFDLFDSPEHVKRLIDSADDIYFEYFDRFRDLLKIGDSMMYTAFDVLGEGKVAKVQCDFAALISPEHFCEFIVPSLTKQCNQLDHSIFHLDGKECIRHLDAIMGIESLQALQWTPNPGMPDGGNEYWHEQVYDKAKEAGKAMHVFIRDGGFDDWVKTADKFVRRYGCKGTYLLFPPMSMAEAMKLEEIALEKWHA
ncbi:MAG: trimethylamine corrinoid protein 2 [Oscillospiraceae bacterium]|nr:trimethylamine corrinoid protein 2 [Oscillospiraceae bacterium]